MSWRAKQKSFQAEYLKRKADKMIEHRNISLADQIFDQLEADILSGKYRRGDIVNEAGLA